MRSILATAAAGWFALNALLFIPQGGGVYENSGAAGGIDGDPGGVAVTWAARALFAGLALVALALIEWKEIIDGMRTGAGPRVTTPR